jgi:hypothetical protein
LTKNLGRIKDLFTFLSSLPGFISLIPMLGMATDCFFGWFPISSTGRGLFYFVFWLGSCLVFAAEVPISARQTANGVGMRVGMSVVLAAALIGVYFGVGMYLQNEPPDARWIRQVVPYGLAVVAGAAMVFFVRAILIVCVKWFASDSQAKTG